MAWIFRGSQKRIARHLYNHASEIREIVLTNFNREDTWEYNTISATTGINHLWSVRISRIYSVFWKLPNGHALCRQSTCGFALLPTLTLLLLLAAITLTLQSRSQTSLRLLARLTTDLQDRAAQDALTDRLRGLVGDAMAGPAPLPGRPRLDGTPFAMDWAGQGWQVRVQDVGGLVGRCLAAFV